MIQCPPCFSTWVATPTTPPIITNLFIGVVLSVRIKMASDTEVLSDGRVETGQNCLDKTLNLGRNGLIGGNYGGVHWVGISFIVTLIGAMYGTFEACFITEKSKSPLIFKAFRLIGARGLLGGYYY